MKPSLQRTALLAAATLFTSLTGTAGALSFSLDEDTGYAKLQTAGVGMNFSFIANPGNAANSASTRGWGAVDITYGMGQTQITWAQYAVFLNDTGRDSYMFSSTNSGQIGLYKNSDGTVGIRSGMADKAVCVIRYAESVAFANWLGTGNADTTGVFSLPSADEWHKAAYFDATRNVPDNPGPWWTYGTSTDTITVGDSFTPGDVFGGFLAVYPNNESWPDADYGTANVHGLYGMTGGLDDWTSTASNTAGTRNWALGGDWSLTVDNLTSNRFTNYAISSTASLKVGFRLAVDVRVALTPISSSEIRDGNGTDVHRIVVATDTLGGFSIADGQTLAFANAHRTEDGYPDGAIGPIPETTQGGGVIFVDEGGAFVAVPANDSGTGKIVFSDNTIQGSTRYAAGGAIFNRVNGTVEIRNGEFTDNRAIGGVSGNIGRDALGGAVFNQGWLRLDNVTFSGNTATGGTSDAGGKGDGQGGAIYSEMGGTVIITNGVFENNTATGKSDGSHSFSGGGAIFNQGTLEISDTRFEGNQLLGNQSSSQGGGAIASQGGTVKLTDVIFKNNSSVNDGGAIIASTISPNGSDFYHGSFDITRGTFEGNTAAKAGGAIANGNSELLLVKDSTFTGNTGASGGAIFSPYSQITNSTFTGNVANWLVAGRIPMGMGGAVAIGATDGESLSSTITDSTFTGNTANHSGGAIWVASSTLVMSDSTFSGNTAGLGGAVFAMGGTDKAASVTFTDTVFTDNSSTANASGVGGGAVSIQGNASAWFVVTAGKELAHTGNTARGTSAAGSYSAAAGGFLFLNSGADGNARATFTIGEGARLTIGATNAVDAAVDSIASNNDKSSITKNGTGTLVLNADNSGFQGTFDVTEGTLVIGETAHAKLGGNVIVHAGATLCGIGTLTGTTTILEGGFLNPGNSPGVLTFENLVLSAGSVVTIEAGDQIVVTGALDFSGLDAGESVVFDLSNFNAEAGNPLFIVFDTVTGIETGKTLGDYVQVSGLADGQTLSFSESGIAVVPEPSTYALLGGVVLAGLLRVCRRGRR